MSSLPRGLLNGRWSLRPLALAAPMVFATQAQAQVAEAPPADDAASDEVVLDPVRIETIVVTATKRETRAQDTPAAVAAVSGAKLESAQSYSIESFSRLDPAVQINNRGIGDNQIIIRGVSSAGKPTVGLYYDEVVMTGLGMDGGSDNQPNLGLHDLQRVEILKGPQGTLFGAGSMSGTVRFISNRPDLYEFSGSVSGSAGYVQDGNPLYRGEAVLNAPIIQNTLGVRAVLWGDEGGGYIDQTRNGDTQEDVNDQSIYGGRFGVGLRPTERLDLLFSVNYQESEADGSQYYEYSEGPYENISPTLEPYEDEVGTYSAVADYLLDFGTVTLTSSLLEREMQYARDSTPTAERFGIPALLSFHEGQDLSNWSSELRFASDFSGPFQVVTGLFFSALDIDSRKAAIVADSETGVGPCDFHEDCVASGYAEADINSGLDTTEIDQLAVFAEGTYDLTDRLQATLGVRYYEADITQRSVATQGLRFPTSPVQTEDVVDLDETISEDEITYNVALSYDLGPDTTLYTRIASGFRPGGVNDSATAAEYGVTVPDAYASDELWNYELGLKKYLFDSRMYAELAVYRIDWSNQQISVTDPGGTFVFIANAGESYVNGTELTLNAEPLDGLSMSLGVTYTESKLSEDLPDTSETVGYDGDRLPYVPEWSFAGQIGYEWPLSARLTGYVGSDFNYRGNSYTDFNDENDNYAEVEDYYLVNANAGVRFDGWDLGLFVDNVTDEVPDLGLRVTGDGYRVYTARPVTAGLRVAKRF